MNSATTTALEAARKLPADTLSQRLIRRDAIRKAIAFGWHPTPETKETR